MPLDYRVTVDEGNVGSTGGMDTNHTLGLIDGWRLNIYRFIDLYRSDSEVVSDKTVISVVLMDVCVRGKMGWGRLSDMYARMSEEDYQPCI